MKTLSLQPRIGAIALAGALVACVGGCAGGETSFDSPESAARLRAIHRAAEEDDRSSIPRLIEMLDSDDPAVRILSIRTLESMTGQTLGYDATAPSYERSPAVDRWEQWYAAKQGSEHNPIQAPPGEPGSRANDSASDPAPSENRNTEGRVSPGSREVGIKG